MPRANTVVGDQGKPGLQNVEEPIDAEGGQGNPPVPSAPSGNQVPTPPANTHPRWFDALLRAAKIYLHNNNPGAEDDRVERVARGWCNEMVDDMKSPETVLKNRKLGITLEDEYIDKQGLAAYLDCPAYYTTEQRTQSRAFHTEAMKAERDFNAGDFSDSDEEDDKDVLQEHGVVENDDRMDDVGDLEHDEDMYDIDTKDHDEYTDGEMEYDEDAEDDFDEEENDEIMQTQY